MYLPGYHRICEKCGNNFLTNNLNQVHCDTCTGKQLSNFATEEHHDMLHEHLNKKTWRPYWIIAIAIIAGFLILKFCL